jgi:hypothetical protein
MPRPVSYQGAAALHGPGHAGSTPQTTRNAATVIAVIQAVAGVSRWCETAVAPPGMARSFLRVFPAASVICLHRTLTGGLTERLRAYPWGLGNSPFWPYAGPHPGNNIAPIADYWMTSAEQLLAFEPAITIVACASGTRICPSAQTVQSEIQQLTTTIEALAEPYLHQVRQLDAVPGVGEVCARDVIAEIGVDMTVFPAAAHLVSWAKWSAQVR